MIRSVSKDQGPLGQHALVLPTSVPQLLQWKCGNVDTINQHRSILQLHHAEQGLEQTGLASPCPPHHTNLNLASYCNIETAEEELQHDDTSVAFELPICLRVCVCVCVCVCVRACVGGCGCGTLWV